MRAVVVALVCTLSLAACTSGAPEPTPPPSAPATGATFAPPAGMRWQGLAGVVVAVPADWATRTSPCLAPARAYVQFQVPYLRPIPCPYVPDRSPARLTISSTGVRGLSFHQQLGRRETVNGLDVRSSGLVCRDSTLGPCSMTFAVPDAGVSFQVSYRWPHPEAFVTALHDSVTAVPDGWTTVPFVQSGFPTTAARATTRLERAGLEVARSDDGSPRSVLGTRPRAGTPVPDGSTVVLIGPRTTP